MLTAIGTDTSGFILYCGSCSVQGQLSTIPVVPIRRDNFLGLPFAQTNLIVASWWGQGICGVPDRDAKLLVRIAASGPILTQPRLPHRSVTRIEKREGRVMYTAINS